MGFPLVAKSVTLNDFDGRFSAFVSPKTLGFGAHRVKVAEARPILSATKIQKPKTVVLDNIQWLATLPGLALTSGLKRGTHVSKAFNTCVVNNSGSVARSIAMFACRLEFLIMADSMV